MTQPSKKENSNNNKENKTEKKNKKTLIRAQVNWKWKQIGQSAQEKYISMN